MMIVVGVQSIDFINACDALCITLTFVVAMYVISFSTMTVLVIHADNPVSPRFDWDYFISSGR